MASGRRDEQKTTEREALEDVVRAARDIADNFTTVEGGFIKDVLTHSEWLTLRQALERLDSLAATGRTTEGTE